ACLPKTTMTDIRFTYKCSCANPPAHIALQQEFAKLLQFFKSRTGNGPIFPLAKIRNAYNLPKKENGCVVSKSEMGGRLTFQTGVFDT
ncbi:MAG: hypothetical protein AAFY04_00575, partial [Pseudomonadota bacterium]